MESKRNWLRNYQNVNSLLIRIALFTHWVTIALKIGAAISASGIFLCIWNSASPTFYYLAVATFLILHVAVTFSSRAYSLKLIAKTKGDWLGRRARLSNAAAMILPAVEKVEILLTGYPEKVQTALQNVKCTAISSQAGILTVVDDMDSIFGKVEALFVGDNIAFLKALPKYLELLSSILPRKNKRECFDPAYNDLLQDYVRMKKFRGTYAEWFIVTFTFRTVLLVTDCFRVFLQNSAGKFFLGLLPESLRNWWQRQ